MAKGGIYDELSDRGDSGGRWHGGGSRGNDGRPGGAGDSRAYAKRYDPEAQEEVTMLPEQSQQLRLAEARRLRALGASQAMLRAQSRVQYFPSLGKFIIPRDNSWASHARLVKDDRTDLHFDPAKYPAFDGVIAQTCGIEALYNPAHRDYAKYEGLRTNLEVLRNDLIGFYLKDGSFDPGDEKYIPYVASIANALGQALATDTWLKRPFTRSISIDVANVEAVGAAEMYKYLLSVQDNPGLFALLKANIKTQLGMENRTWGLEPIEHTPFSDANLSAPPAHQGMFYSEQELVERCATPEMQEKVQLRKQSHVERLEAEKLAPTYKGLA